MKIFTTVAQLSEELSRRLQGGSVKVIGIDGKDGAGKSYLATALSRTQGAEVLSLDEYVAGGQGGYTAYLDLAAIKHRLISLGPPVIIEGVCLLAAAEQIDVRIDIRIYVKRMGPCGTWQDEEECDPALPPEELIAELDTELKQFGKYDAILGGSSPGVKENMEDCDVALPGLVKELIRYHAKYRPASNADYVFERSEDDD